MPQGVERSLKEIFTLVESNSKEAGDKLYERLESEGRIIFETWG